MEHVVENHDQVTITFIGSLDNGAVFTRVAADTPMTFLIGDAELPPSVEQSLIGMKIGGNKNGAGGSR